MQFPLAESLGIRAYIGSVALNVLVNKLAQNIPSHSFRPIIGPVLTSAFPSNKNNGKSDVVRNTKRVLQHFVKVLA